MTDADLLHLLALDTVALVEAARDDGADRARSDLDAAADAAARQGTSLLSRLARAAVQRLLGGDWLTAARFFLPTELVTLADALVSTMAHASTLGRLAMLGRLLSVLARPTAPRPPQQTLDLFRTLTPTLGRDPQRQGETMARTAFTLAVAVDTDLLAKVKTTIADRLKTGEVGTGGRAVQAVLDAAGVGPTNKGYADTVFRTNAMSAYHDAFQHEMTAASENFPTWRYSNPRDTRSRKWHAKRNGLYFSAALPFVVVRGTEPRDVMRCRCLPIPIDKWKWAKLVKGGAVLTPLHEVPKE